MRRIVTLAVVAVGAAALAPAAATASTSTGVCHVTVTKTDNGHGIPSAWADLVLHRATTATKTATGYSVHLADKGHLWTRKGAGSPNGTGASIKRRVGGSVVGSYDLTVTGGTLNCKTGDPSASSTEYVKSLFGKDAQVSGGAYSWTYTTCREKWVDSSANSDGQGAGAGNITGLRCAKPSPSPTPSGSVTPSPTTSTPPGEAPAPTPVPGNLGVTG